MHVLLIHQAFVSPEEAGGTRHYELGRFVVSNRHQFTIVAANLSYLTGRAVTATGGLVTGQNLDGVRVLRAYTYPSLHRSFTWRVVSFLSFMVTSVYAALRAGKVDVVMGTSPPIFQAFSAWLVSFLRRRPFLLEIRDLWPEFAIKLGVLTNPLLIGAARTLERFLYRRATHLLVNSPAYRDYLLSAGIPPEKISLVANGVDADMFDPAERGETVRDEFKLDGKFVVTYAGALGMANDLETLIRAAQVLRAEPDLLVMIVGDGKERPRLESLVRESNLSNVLFAGARPKREMPAFLAASDACIAILRNIPAFRTTYPNKVFDYMAAGRPIVLAIDGVIREVVELAGAGIYVPPGDPKALADAMLSLKKDPAAAQGMGRAARDYVAKNFDRQAQARAFLDLLLAVAHRSS
jgi:glycosyltransferase involved in cell wall biosynthesis